MAASKNAGPDLGVIGGGEWLYRQGELVLGPLPAPQLVARLYTGEITGRTEVSKLGQENFRHLSEVDFFKIHLAKAEAKLRVEAVAQAQQAKSTRSRNLRIGIVAAIALFVAGAAASGARYLAVHNPFKSSDEFAEISVEAPTIALARARGKDEDLVDYPGDTHHGDHAGRERAGRTGSGGRTTSGADDPEGMQTAKFDQPGISAVVAQKQRSLYGCFSEEGRRNPGFSAKIPIEFVIGNDGHVNKLWVDDPKYKQGPLADCLFHELQKWPFKPYDGEQATVGLSFKIGKG